MKLSTSPAVFLILALTLTASPLQGVLAASKAPVKTSKEMALFNRAWNNTAHADRIGEQCHITISDVKDTSATTSQEIFTNELAATILSEITLDVQSLQAKSAQKSYSKVSFSNPFTNELITLGKEYSQYLNNSFLNDFSQGDTGGLIVDPNLTITDPGSVPQSVQPPLPPFVLTSQEKDSLKASIRARARVVAESIDTLSKSFFRLGGTGKWNTWTPNADDKKTLKTDLKKSNITELAQSSFTFKNYQGDKKNQQRYAVYSGHVSKDLLNTDEESTDIMALLGSGGSTNILRDSATLTIEKSTEHWKSLKADITVGTQTSAGESSFTAHVTCNYSYGGAVKIPSPKKSETKSMTRDDGKLEETFGIFQEMSKGVNLDNLQ